MNELILKELQELKSLKESGAIKSEEHINPLQQIENDFYKVLNENR